MLKEKSQKIATKNPGLSDSAYQWNLATRESKTYKSLAELKESVKLLTSKLSIRNPKTLD